MRNLVRKMEEVVHSVDMKVRVSENLKKDLDAIARMEGKSTSSLIRDALAYYVREVYYGKAGKLLNLEDRFGSAVVSELFPLLEDIRRMLSGYSGMPKQITPNVPIQEDEEIIYQGEDESNEEGNGEGNEEEKKDEQDFPKIPGLHYKVDGENVVYEDGSIYNLHLGAWLVTKEEVARWRRKKEKERWGL